MNQNKPRCVADSIKARLYNLAKQRKEDYNYVLRQFMKEAQPIGGPPEPGSLEARTKAFLEANLP